MEVWICLERMEQVPWVMVRPRVANRADASRRRQTLSISVKMRISVKLNSPRLPTRVEGLVKAVDSVWAAERVRAVRPGGAEVWGIAVRMARVAAADDVAAAAAVEVTADQQPIHCQL